MVAGGSDTKILPDSEKRKPPAAGKGRPKGSLNKTTAAVKDMILSALSNKGGVKYLEEQADKNPTAFLSLVGKVIPLDVNASGNLTIEIVRFGE